MLLLEGPPVTEPAIVESEEGVLCPRCGNVRTVVNATYQKTGGTIRFRDCPKCGVRVRTFEKITNVVPRKDRKPYVKNRKIP